MKTGFGLIVIGWLAVAAASPARADPAATTLALVDGVVIPRFQAVADAAHGQEMAWTDFCRDRRRARTAALLDAYGKVGDAWARIEFAKIGPADAKGRALRFDFWLDRPNATGKALDAMLTSDDPQSRQPATIAAGSVAGQGLPVIERLLYDRDAQARLKAAGIDGDRRCATGAAVAHNLSDLADAIVMDWTSPDGARAALAANRRWGAFFADGSEAARVFLTDILVGLEALKDSKVPYLFHDEQNPDAPRLAEGARSGRTLRDIQLNFAVLREALAAYMAPTASASKQQLDAALDDAAAKLEAVAAAERTSPPHSDKRTQALQAAVASFTDLQMMDIPLVQAATGITLGLNGLDGD